MNKEEYNSSVTELFEVLKEDLRNLENIDEEISQIKKYDPKLAILISEGVHANIKTYEYLKTRLEVKSEQK